MSERDWSKRIGDRNSWREARPAFLLLVLSALCFWAAFAQAATITVTCTPPTTNTDGSAITATLTYRAYWGTSATTLTNAVPLSGPGCKGSVVVHDAPAGQSVTYHLAVTAIAVGQESVKSNIATKTFSTPLPTPNPPILLTEGGLVWMASPNYTTFGWKLGSTAGTIAAGIKCDATRRIGDDYYRVTGPIVWATTKKNYVVAKCQETKEFG
jgi:hypothetical protein